MPAHALRVLVFGITSILRCSGNCYCQLFDCLFDCRRWRYPRPIRLPRVLRGPNLLDLHQIAHKLRLYTRGLETGPFAFFAMFARLPIPK